MSPGIEHGNPGFKREIESLQATYGNAAFIRSVFKVFFNDSPEALPQLIAAYGEGSVEAARSTIRSVANIMGIAGQASSRPLIESISIEVASIRSWLDSAGWLSTSSGKFSKGNY